MKELVLFVDGKTVGPFPLEDVKKRFSAGEFPAETPCAEPGDTDWKPLGEVIPPERPAVRIARKTREEEQEMKTATSEKLDPDVRKKLLLYNLADAISVDKFTPVQADTAIRLHEEAMKKGKKLKIAAGVGGFLISFALASLLFTGVNFGTAPGGKGQKLFEKIFENPGNPEYQKTAKRIRGEAENLSKLRDEVASIKFVAPRNQGDPRQTFLGNVEIKNPDVSTVSGTLDTSSIPENLKGNTLIEVIQLKRLDGSVEENIKKQEELFAVLTSPLWTDADLRNAIADELAEDFPKCDAPEATEFTKRLALMKIEGLDAQLQWMTKRIGEISQNKEIQTRVQSRVKEKLSARKKTSAKKEAEAANSQRVAERAAANRRVQDWASRDMPKFLEKLADFLAENEIRYSAEARATAWREFSEKTLPEISTKISENETQRVPVGTSGAFILDGRNDRNIIAVAHFENAGDVYFVPAKEESATGILRMQNLSVNRRTLKPEDVLMDEIYLVSEKVKTGGEAEAANSQRVAERAAANRRVQDWASRDMPKFLEKLADFLAENEIRYSAEARATAWREFSEKTLPEISTKISENETQRVPVGTSGAFILDGRNDRNIIAVAHFENAGDVYFVPAKEESATGILRMQNLSVNRRTLKPEDVLMDEIYLVSEKVKTGGVPLVTSGKILSHEIFIVRTTPEWCYITVEKKLAEGEDSSRRRNGITLGVPAEFYESVAVGDTVPMEKLLAFPRFGKPAESPATGRLIPIPEDKLEAVKEQQTAAGIAFPPPPEKYVPPAPETPVAPADGEISDVPTAPASEIAAEEPPPSEESSDTAEEQPEDTSSEES